MAALTGNALVGALKYELGRSVIEGPQLLPLPDIVAEITRKRGGVRIVVANSAGLGSKMVLASCR